MTCGVLDQLEEVGPNSGLTPTNVDVEDLHLGQLVDDGFHLGWSLSSFGSRRPDELRQCTHARLQAYVHSQVKQMGELRPAFI